MTTSIEQIDGPPQVLSYASPVTPSRERRSPMPWLALSSGVLAWVPVFLSFFGSKDVLGIAPALGYVGLAVAWFSIVNSDKQSGGYRVVGALSLLSTLAGIYVAISALIN